MGTFTATKNTEQHLNHVRTMRNRYLRVTDFYVSAESHLAAEDRARVEAWRSLLRNCTNPPPGQQAAVPGYSAADLPESVKTALKLEFGEES